VDEPNSNQSTIIVFEFEAYPEPKALSPVELMNLYVQHKNYRLIARIIGASEAFVRQNMKK
jgi:hypothetical protein